jgi:hypothetical protein
MDDVANCCFYVFRLPEIARAAVTGPAFALRLIIASSVQLARCVGFEVSHRFFWSLAGVNHHMDMVRPYMGGKE